MTSALHRAPVAPAAPARDRMMHVVQGEFAVVDEPNVVLTTILGSCVATCMWDSVAGVGGMNHFLLPGDEDTGSDSVRYGVNAMELLINGLLQRGALRSRMQAKLFGGAHVIQNLSDIGEKNAAFATKFLQMEGIACAAQSLGGDRARRIRFWATTGRAGQMLLEATSPEAQMAERAKPAPKPAASAAGSIELF
jgi:chemotaxis protein CheD